MWVGGERGEEEQGSGKAEWGRGKVRVGTWADQPEEGGEPRWATWARRRRS